MSDTAATPPVPSPSPTSAPRGSGERVAWWITFGVLVAAAVIMAGAWN